MIHFSPVEYHIEDRAHTRLCDGRPASDTDVSSEDWFALRDARKDATLCPDCQDKVNSRDVRSDHYGYDRMSPRTSTPCRCWLPSMRLGTARTADGTPTMTARLGEKPGKRWRY